ncbi:transcription termination factor MTERF15, mitochondrial-like [Phragmites australis]|uniref:transcription termination factor MTERF15, mitochondrial-like n=1 Tax=Phragmites australis TaxID=29695 RepID=UPI002D779501|nr:transcription termination factor MTERF15, mitochondrial-like [Phragmites australis]XP_062203318.1 transcription termination factor MTERF15, mitochondrial-like [Phragmites australis]
MALAIRALRRRHLPHPTRLSTSASSPDTRELLRIERILHNPAVAAQPPKLQEHPRAAAAAARLQDLLHSTAGLTAAESASLLRRLPVLDTQPSLALLLQELSGLGLPGHEVKAALASDPDGLLAMDPGEPSRLLEFLAELRCRKAVKDQVLAHGVLRAAVATRRRVGLLHARGLIRRDALRVLAAEPRALLYSPEDVERKVEFLVNTMGFEVGWLVQYPEFLGVNLDNWIVPRHNVVEHLRLVGGLGDPVEMKHYVRLSRRRFYNMFVKPYPECERIFGGLVREREEMVRRGHPTGLWKLFTPTRHDTTQEDVKNMKLLVESLR